MERGLFNNYRAVLKHGIQIPETESQKGERKRNTESNINDG